MPHLNVHLRAGEVAAALETVEACEASLAAELCLRFLILTAARSGEARGATWNEIHEDAREWRIPDTRMKSGVEHRVPLSDAAVAVLEQARPLRDGSRLLFPSFLRPGHPMSDTTLTKVLRATGLAQRTTVVGFRSAFQVWASECTNTSYAVVELSLARAVGPSVEQAYARSDLIEERRALMQRWADFVTGVVNDHYQTVRDRYQSAVKAAKTLREESPRWGRIPLSEMTAAEVMELDPSEFDKCLHVLIKSTTQEDWDGLSIVAQSLLRDDRQLPPVLAHWAADALGGVHRRPRQGAKRTSTRDPFIVFAIFNIFRDFGLTPTRTGSAGGRAGEGQSACDAVGEAWDLSYKAVEAIYCKFKPRKHK